MSASIGFKATELGFTNILILGTPVNKFWQQKTQKITTKSLGPTILGIIRKWGLMFEIPSLLIEIWFSRLPADFSTYTHIYTLHPFGHRRILGIPRRLRQRGRSQLRSRGGARQAHGTRLPWRLARAVPYGLVDELVTIQHMGIWLFLMVVKWWFFKVVHGISPTKWWLFFFLEWDLTYWAMFKSSFKMFNDHFRYHFLEVQYTKPMQGLCKEIWDMPSKLGFIIDCQYRYVAISWETLFIAPWLPMKKGNKKPQLLSALPTTYVWLHIDPLKW